MNPMLWRLAACFAPGLPSPTNSSIDEPSAGSAGPVPGEPGPADAEAYFFSAAGAAGAAAPGAAAAAPSAGAAPASGAAAAAAAAGAAASGAALLFFAYSHRGPKVASGEAPCSRTLTSRGRFISL